MKRRVQHVRRKQNGSMDREIFDIKLPILELPDGSTFNLYENQKKDDRLIILGSKRGLKTVSKSRILLIDGIFDSAPSTSMESFYQTFVIHAEFMDTGEIFPCLFCVMEYRTQRNYEELYTKLK